MSEALMRLSGAAVSVLDCGARGDGSTDCTAAFHHAIRRAKEAGLAVCVPGGRYRLRDTLCLNGVSLWGDPSGSWPANSATQPTLLFDAPSVPGIRLADATLSGLCIRTAGDPDAAPTILVEGDDVTVENLKLFNAARGVVTARPGLRGLKLQDLFMADPQYIGVELDGCRGETVIRNVEVWPSTTAPVPFAQNGMGFRLSDNDQLWMEDCFVWNAQRAILLEETDGRGNTVYMNNCSVDFCANGLVVYGTHDITVEGGTFWNHYTGVQLMEGASRLRMRCMDLKSNGAPVMEVRAVGALSCEGLILRRTMDDREVPVLWLEGGEDLHFSGCSIAANCHEQPAVYIGAPRRLTLCHSIISHPDCYAYSPAHEGCRIEDNVLTTLT